MTQIIHTLMLAAFRVLMSPGYKFIFAFLFALFTLIYIAFCLMIDPPILAAAFTLVALIDLAGIVGFVFRKPIGRQRFWKAWYIWSLFFFFCFGFGHDAFGVTTISVTQIFRALYYASFLGMLYIYAFLDAKPWAKA